MLCGGKDRARWDRNKELYFCNQCGCRDPVSLLMEFHNKTFRELAEELRPNLGRYKVTNVTSNDNAKQRIQLIWKGLKAISGTVGHEYFKSRGLTVLPDRDCYFHEGIDYYEDGESKGKYPAIVSRFSDVDNRLCTVHITYLDRDGNKLDVGHPKKIMPVIMPLAGSSIKLFEPGKHLALAEGVETALAVYELEGYPCWATGSAGNTEKIELPSSIQAITIYVDEDDNYAGAKSAYILANRLSIKGLKVRMCRLDKETKRYEVGTKFDFLDYLNS